MKIINKENYLKNNQILQILNILSKDFQPNKLIIYEKRNDLLRSAYIPFVSIWLGRVEGTYRTIDKSVHIFVFSQNDDGENKHSKQFYSIHALLHELRHCYQDYNNIDFDENDCDNFATNFINNNSKTIKDIMKWRREWEIEEED